MDAVVVLSIIFAVMGFIAANVITYKSFGSLHFLDCVVFGTLGAATGVLIGIFVTMVGVSIVF